MCRSVSGIPHLVMRVATPAMLDSNRRVARFIDTLSHTLLITCLHDPTRAVRAWDAPQVGSTPIRIAGRAVCEEG